ncbi:MAG TPA: tetratricopeptide repeat protein [Phototrophicaceae bacterium]|nr:tetratricopeptide repeat protein [Phototrophicaceae bacterium]
MAKNQEYAEQLGKAWALHRQGQNADAITEFNNLLKLSANNIDALYGLGLAQRSNHQLEAAQASFERCLEQIGAAAAEHPREDRYLMLQRITRQRLDELKDSQ